MQRNTLRKRDMSVIERRTRSCDARVRPIPSKATPPAWIHLLADLPNWTWKEPVAASPETHDARVQPSAAFLKVTCRFARKASFLDACIESDDRKRDKRLMAASTSERKRAAGASGNCCGRISCFDADNPRLSYVSRKIGVKDGDEQATTSPVLTHRPEARCQYMCSGDSRRHTRTHGTKEQRVAARRLRCQAGLARVDSSCGDRLTAPHNTVRRVAQGMGDRDGALGRSIGRRRADSHLQQRDLLVEDGCGRDKGKDE